MLIGLLKRAAAPTPSAKPACPLPASVATTPLSVTLRRFMASDKSKLPSLSTVMPCGQLKRASPPWPSFKPVSVLCPARGACMQYLVMTKRAEVVHTTRIPSGTTAALQTTPPSEVRSCEVTSASRPEWRARLGARQLAMTS